MRRLLDSAPDGTVSETDRARARALLASVGPLERSGARRSRVWQRLALADLPKSSLALRWIAIPAILLGTGTLAAREGRLPFFGLLGESAPPALERTSDDSAKSARTPGTSAPTRKAEAHVAVPETVPEAAAVPAPIDSTVRHVSPKSAPKAREAHVDPKTADESTLLVEALKARRAGDTARAAALSAEYRRRHPEGVLGEEALALSLDAALRRNDPKAPELAKSYLARYPNGRFRQQAERALVRPTR